MIKPFYSRHPMQAPHARAFSVLEVLVYIGIITMVSVVVVTGLIQLSTAYAKARNARHVNEIGALTMERIVREVRRATALSPNGASSIALTIPMTYAELVKCGTPPTCDDGAVAHWDFEESIGNVLADKIGGAHGTVINSPTLRTLGVSGHGYTLNGSSQYIALPDNAFNALTQGAVEVIFKKNATDGLRSFFGGFPMTGGPPWVHFYSSDTNASKLWRPYSYQNSSILPAASDDLTTYFSTGAYHHVVFAVSASGLQVYVDGVLDGASAQAPANKFFNFLGNSNKYRIGVKETGVFTEYFNGTLDEIALYNEPHTLGFWQARYNTVFGGTPQTKTVTLTGVNNSIIISENAGVGETLTSGKVTISDLIFTPITGGGAENLGVRISLTATAGTGKTQVSQSFVTSAMLRNP